MVSNYFFYVYAQKNFVDRFFYYLLKFLSNKTHFKKSPENCLWAWPDLAHLKIPFAKCAYLVFLLSHYQPWSVIAYRPSLSPPRCDKKDLIEPKDVLALKSLENRPADLRKTKKCSAHILFQLCPSSLKLSRGEKSSKNRGNAHANGVWPAKSLPRHRTHTRPPTHTHLVLYSKSAKTTGTLCQNNINSTQLFHSTAPVPETSKYSRYVYATSAVNKFAQAITMSKYDLLYLTAQLTLGMYCTASVWVHTYWRLNSQSLYYVHMYIILYFVSAFRFPPVMQADFDL